MTSFNKVQDAREAAEDAEGAYLRSRGWEHKCDNPTCCWLWEKALPDGRIVVVSRETAVALQSQSDGISLKNWPKPEKAKAET